MIKRLDKKQKIELGIITIGIIFLIFLLAGNMGKASRKHEPAGKKDTAFLPASSSPKISGIALYDADKTWGRDPFFPDIPFSGASGSDLNDVTLNGIVWGGEDSYAIINNDIIKKGDKLGDMTVVEINEKSVVLEQDGKRYVLELKAF